MAALLTQISVYEGETLLFRKALPPGEYLIGHDTGAGISFSAEGVSARHAMLHLRSTEWLIEDLGGGTFVNDQPITEARSVFPTQRISLGKATIVLDRLKSDESALDTLAPQTAAVQELLPEKNRREKKYEIGPVVGKGGMGVILVAREVPVERNVAMKLMPALTRRGDVERFVREAQVTAQLEHPNIVPVHELDVNELDQPFYTMKYVRGVSLGKVLKALALGDSQMVREYSLSSLLTAFQKICDAIAFAHSKGVIHRDLKPDNIMLGEYGEVLVMDWGLAKVINRRSKDRGPMADAREVGAADCAPVGSAIRAVTQVGTVMGTLQYMPPEQARGNVENLDETGDIYALGAILHHILALRPPIDGQDDQELLENVCAGRIRPLNDRSSTRALPHLAGGRIPDSLGAVARKAMARDPGQRYASVKALQADITAYQTGFATSAERAGAWKLAALFLRRHRAVSVAAALLLVTGIVFTVSLAMARTKAQRAERLATKQRDTTENRLYVSDMLQAGSHIAEDRSESARQLLARHRLESSGRDLRGWEWFYLDGQLNQDRLRTYAHAGGVYGLAATSDGAQLATGGGDGEIAVWQTRGLLPRFRIRAAHKGTVFCVAWQTGGRMLASGGSDGMVCIWDTESQKKVAEVRVGTGSEVRTIAWQPLEDGSGGLALGGLEKKVYFWRPLAASPPPPPEELFTTQNGTACLHWSVDGRRLSAGKLNTKQNVEVFDIESRSMIFSDRPEAGSDVLTTAITPSSKYLAAGSKHGAVIVFDLTSRRKVFEEILHRGYVRSIAWRPDGKQLASAGQDGTIRVLQPSQRDLLPQIFRGHIGEVDTVIWTNVPGDEDPATEHSVLISGGADGTLRAWKPNVIEHTGFAVKNGNWVSAVRWSRDGKRIAMIDFRDHVHVIDRASGLSLPLCAPPRALFDVAWSPDGNRLAATRRDTGRVDVLDVATGRPTQSFVWPQAEHVVWSPSGNFLLAAGASGTCIWDAHTGSQIAIINRASGGVAWSGDDRHIALGGADGAIELWDALSGKRTAQWRSPQNLPSGSIPLTHEPPCKVNDVEWSRDGRFLAFGAMDRSAGLLDARDGHLVRTFSEHIGAVYGVTWSPDGRRLATCSQDGSARVFDASTGDLVARIDHGGGNSELRTIDWSPDGRQLVTGGDDQVVRVWDASRSYDFEAVAELRRLAEQIPNDGTKLRDVGLICAQLGRSDQAREALSRASEVNGGLFSDEIARAETFLAHTLDGLAGATTVKEKTRGFSLLNAIHDHLDANNTPAAVTAFQELVAVKGSAEILGFARTYFSRAQWMATWFPSHVDPRQDLDGWRSLASGGDAVTAAARLLCFSYGKRGPKDLLLSPQLSERGPSREPFGMIAHARLNLSVGKWRFSALGRDGVRIIVNGRTILEHWTGQSAIDSSSEYEQSLAGEADVTIEHFALTHGSSLQVLLEPATREQ